MTLQIVFGLLYLILEIYFVATLYQLVIHKKANFKFIIFSILVQLAPVPAYFIWEPLKYLLLFLQPLYFYFYFLKFEKLRKSMSLFFGFFVINTIKLSQTFVDVFISSIIGDQFFYDNISYFAFFNTLIGLLVVKKYFKLLDFKLLSLEAPQYEERINKFIKLYVAIYLGLRFSDVLEQFPQFDSTASMIVFFCYLTFMYSIYYLRDHQIKWTQQQDLEIQRTIAESVNNKQHNVFNSIGILRAFRHDIGGILRPMESAIKKRCMEEIERLYYTLFEKSNDQISSPLLDNFEFLNIEDINIRGLFENAFVRSIELDLDFKFEAKDVIGIVDLPALELNRVVQIILNNAVEAAHESDKKMVRVAIFRQDEEVVLIVKNSVKDGNINLRDIYKNSFSTKGENRGIGLYTVGEIVENHEEISIDTRVEENVFEQIVHLQYKGAEA